MTKVWRASGYILICLHYMLEIRMGRKTKISRVFGDSLGKTQENTTESIFRKAYIYHNKVKTPEKAKIYSKSEKLIDSTKHREQVIKQMDHYMPHMHQTVV